MAMNCCVGELRIEEFKNCCLSATIEEMNKFLELLSKQSVLAV